MIRSRAAFRFWTAMSAAPAAVAACAGGGDPRPPETPITPLVVGSGGPSTLEVSPPVTTDETSKEPACGIDQYAASSCIWVGTLAPTKEGNPDSSQCPKTTSTAAHVRSPFGTKTTARLDAKKTDEAGGTMCCYDWCEQIRISRAPVATCQPPLHLRHECIAMPERGTTAPAPAPFDRCPSGVVLREVDGQKGTYPGQFVDTASTPPGDQGAATCCYAVCGPMMARPVIGRPPRDGDEIPIAPAIASDAWRAPSPIANDARDVPLEDALLEHASVAAFARLSLSLLAFGAPPDLVARAHEAAIDEIRHAQISFARAGRSIGPGPCPSFAELRAHRSLAELAEETWVDGCVGETIASLKLRACGDDEPFRSMAHDEARHAELAWRIVEWAIAVGGDDVRERVSEAARRTRPRAGDALASWAHENVVGPCTEVVLA